LRETLTHTLSLVVNYCKEGERLKESVKEIANQ
jgi:hypothetical protein